MYPVRTLAALICCFVLVACQPRAVADDPIVGEVVNNNTAAISAFLANGGDPDLKDRNGDPLLYIAVGARGGIEAATVLLNGGADPNGVSAEGRSVLANAAGWCDIDSVRLLLSAGAQPGALLEDGSIENSVCKAPLDRRQAVITLLEQALGD